MKRIIAIDFGTARVGVAMSDELHIAIRTLPTLLYTKPDFWIRLLSIIKSNDVGCVVLGVPYEENEEHPMRLPIENFESKLTQWLNTENIAIPIMHQDEAYSSKNAVTTMMEIGTKKKKRTTKGIVDGFAAAIILRDYIETLS